MSDQPAPASTSDQAGNGPPKRSLKDRLLHEAKRLVGIFLYLWVLLGLFAIHESIVLAKHNIPYRPFGVALINAWILAKVMLIAEDLKLGEGWFGHRPPIYRILAKAVAFAMLFLVVHFVENVLVGMWRGKTISESLPTVGDGSTIALISVAILLAFALIPFFAFKEADRALGGGVLRAVLLKGRRDD
jgi:hypothetical protein